MRNSIKRHLALWTIFFFLFSMTGCGGGGGGGGSDNNGTGSTSQTADLRNYLEYFNLTMDWVATDLPAVMETVDHLNTALDEYDGSAEKVSEINTLVDQFASDTDMLVADVETMDATETEIQKIIHPENSLGAFAFAPAVAVVVCVSGLLAFAHFLKDRNKKMSGARDEWEKAQTDVGNAVAGALQREVDARKKMADIGVDVGSELLTKVSTDLALSPFNPTSVVGVVLKNFAGNKLQKGLKVISVTSECASGGDNPGCKIGVSKTDQSGSAVTPDGDVIAVIGGSGMAREGFQKEIPSGYYTEVTVDPIPIDEATPEKIADRDDAANGDDNSSTMTISSSASSESNTYTVTASLTGITGPTTVTITAENGSTGTPTKTLTADGTVAWTVIANDGGATVTVRRSDTGDQQSLTLSGNSYDGTYFGSAVATYDGTSTETGCYCYEVGTEFGIRIVVAGSSLSGDVSGTLNGNQINAVENDDDEVVLSGSIASNVMSGTWHTTDGCCSGTFSLTKQ